MIDESVTESTGNVFRDLGLPDPGIVRLASELSILLHKHCGDKLRKTPPPFEKIPQMIRRLEKKLGKAVDLEIVVSK